MRDFQERIAPIVEEHWARLMMAQLPFEERLLARRSWMHENAAFVTAAACGCGAVLILCVIGLVLCPRDELVHASPLKVFWVD